MEFITSYLNNAANDADIKNGTALATLLGIKTVSPKFGISKSDYFFMKEKGVIAKGLSSVKYMGKAIADELYDLSVNHTYNMFSDLLFDLTFNTSLDTRQIEILIKIDFFSDFGNQRELFTILDAFNRFKSAKGMRKKIDKASIDGTQFESAVRAHSVGVTKAGKESSNYTLIDPMQIVRDLEEQIRNLHVPDLGLKLRIQNYYDAIGYMGYVTDREEDRSTLYINDVYPIKRKRDGVIFGHSILTVSAGSGIESRFTVFNRVFDKDPIRKGDVIKCLAYTREGKYFRMDRYEHVLF